MAVTAAAFITASLILLPCNTALVAAPVALVNIFVSSALGSILNSVRNVFFNAPETPPATPASRMSWNEPPRKATTAAGPDA